VTAPRKRQPAAPTAAGITAAWQPVIEPVRICLDSELVLRIEDLEEQLLEAQRQDAVSNRAPVAPGIAEQVLGLQEQARAAEVEFRFRSLGRRAYSDLLRAHPPTEAQKADAPAGQVLMWDADTFPPALMSATCVQPADTTLDWWRGVYDDWGLGQVERLWKACLTANAGVAEIPKARVAYAMIHGSAPS